MRIIEEPPNGEIVEEIEEQEPAQTEDLDGNWEVEPEKKLIYAILEDAVNLVVRARNATETRKAYEWICSNDVRWPFSFLNICRELEVDAENLRARVRKAQSPPASYPKKQAHSK